MKFLKIFIFSFFLIIIFITSELIIEYDSLNYLQLSNNAKINNQIDIIVVLTGHKGRIKQGFRFLKKLNSKILIISGANPKSSKNDILTPYEKYKNLFNRVIIENRSTNTKENAEQLKKFLQKYNYPLNILIITSTTHLKRAKYIFEHIFKNSKVKLYFLPAPEKITFKKIIKEKIKYFLDYILFNF